MQKKSRGQLVVITLIIGSFLLGSSFSNAIWNAAINETDIWHASKIIGLDFTRQEIDSLLDGVTRFEQTYQENRQYHLPNSVSPALHFNPIPVGYKLETTQNDIIYDIPKNVDLPEEEEALAFYSVQQLAELIRTQKITSEALTQFFIDRIKKYDPTLHCVISLTEELALKQAQKADREIKAGNYKGVLHGIPYGAKDLLATKTYKTTWGAMPYKEQSFDYDATVIEKLEEAGAILVAKTTLGALAMGDVWYGEKTRNPWDITTGSSGSSAGSASAVAAGLLPFAIGTETLGSIVSPSTTCGATGLRPTFGRVSKHGAMALSWSMDKIGPLCRTVEDCAIIFDAIRGSDGKDLSVIDAPFNYNGKGDGKKLKIGYVKGAFSRNYGFKKQDSLALETYEKLGYELIPIELPPLPDLSMILFAEAGAAFDELTLSGQDDLLVRQIKGAWPNIFRQSRFIPAVEYIKANRLRTQLMNQMEALFEQVDVYIHPSWASSSLRITNYTGHPCVVLPNGFQKNGRPTSISFTGKLFGEAEVMEVAKIFQEHTEFHLMHPEL